MSESSWLKDEATSIRYRFDNGSTWLVANEYQPELCPHCNQTQYCRLTHIWPLDAEGQPSKPLYHINRGVDLAELKTVTIQCLLHDDRQIAVHEVEVDGEWALEADGKIIARQIMD